MGKLILCRLLHLNPTAVEFNPEQPVQQQQQQQQQQQVQMQQAAQYQPVMLPNGQVVMMAVQNPQMQAQARQVFVQQGPVQAAAPHQQQPQAGFQNRDD